MYAFGNRSQSLLLTVKPSLRKVAERAIQLSKVDFGVVQGARTLDQQKRLYGQGRSGAQCVAKGIPAAYARPDMNVVTWTLNSNHIGGNAIDVCPVINGNFVWDNDGRLGLWPQVATAFKAAATETGIPIYWGGDWKGKQNDRPHFSIVPG